MPFLGPYAASKFGVEGLAQVLADELESTPIRVNTINPGATQTLEITITSEGSYLVNGQLLVNKRPETKISRLEKIIPMINQGIGLNDKYKK